MKKTLLVFCAILLAAVITESLYIFNKGFFTTSVKKELPQPKPLLAYTFENLKKIKFPDSNITVGPVISENTDSVSRMFYF